MYFFSFCFLLISPPSLLSPIFFLPSPFWTSGFTRTLYLFTAYGSLMSIFALFFPFF